MIATWLKRELRKFSRRYDYDTSYMEGMVEADPVGGFKLALASRYLGHRFGLPAGPYFAAKITAVKAADCGSCLKLAIRMAEEAHVGRDHVVALVAGSPDELPHDMALAARYARAVIDNGPELMEIIDECRNRWGERGLAGLATAVVSGFFYPTLKRGLGHGNFCEPVIAWLRARPAGRGSFPREMIGA